MKRSFSFYSVAISAILAIGSLFFASCEKENDVFNTPNTKNASDERRIFPIDQNFTDSNGTVWYVWGSGHIMGRRVIDFDIKFRHGFSSAETAEIPRHFVGTVRVNLDGTCEIIGANFHMTTEVKDFLHDFAKYWLHL